MVPLSACSTCPSLCPGPCSVSGPCAPHHLQALSAEKELPRKRIKLLQKTRGDMSRPEPQPIAELPSYAHSDPFSHTVITSTRLHAVLRYAHDRGLESLGSLLLEYIQCEASQIPKPFLRDHLVLPGRRPAPQSCVSVIRVVLSWQAALLADKTALPGPGYCCFDCQCSDCMHEPVLETHHKKD